MQTIFSLSFFNHPHTYIYKVKPISTSIVHKPKQLVTESQITLSCEVEGSVPDTEIKWTQNNRLFERGTVRESWTFFYYCAFSFKSRKTTMLLLLLLCSSTVLLHFFFIVVVQSVHHHGWIKRELHRTWTRIFFILTFLIMKNFQFWGVVMMTILQIILIAIN